MEKFPDMLFRVLDVWAWDLMKMCSGIYNRTERIYMRRLKMDRKYQIFVSSTYKDLIEERQSAINVIMKLGHIPAGMELFTATGEEQFETIKPIIDESDYYLIILGGKYGSISSKEKVSYTEKEFDYALSKGKRIIAFVHSDPDNLHSSQREEKAQMISKFRKFREKILRERMVCMWENKAQLAANISTSIANVINQFPEKTYWIHINEDKDKVSKDDLIRQLKIDDCLIKYCNEDCFVYSTNVPQNSLNVNSVDETSKELELGIKFDIISQNDYSDKFAGYCIKDLPDDWRGLIQNGYFLNINYETDNDVNIWVEIKTSHIELYKKEFLLSGKNSITIDMGKYAKNKDKWVGISEMCLVFRPYYNKSVDGNIKISDISFVNGYVE